MGGARQGRTAGNVALRVAPREDAFTVEPVP